MILKITIHLLVISISLNPTGLEMVIQSSCDLICDFSRQFTLRRMLGIVHSCEGVGLSRAGLPKKVCVCFCQEE